MKISNEWWTAPAEADNGRVILVTGRRDMENVIQTRKFIYRVEVTWPYEADAKGLPDRRAAQLMGDVHDALAAVFDADPVAVMTGVYTGDGERNWVFYARSLHLFQKKLNEALAPFDVLPLQFHAEEDPEWAEYREMCLTEVSASDD
ncbi:MAG: DUF695 domain-containing protein [Muribaculaceae bacterium]|nr:DUF695 domain-containing protein [Muribaculaceae bacterium]